MLPATDNREVSLIFRARIFRWIPRSTLLPDETHRDYVLQFCSSLPAGCSDRHNSVQRIHAPAYQWKPKSALIPPLPLPTSATDATALIDFTNLSCL